MTTMTDTTTALFNDDPVRLREGIVPDLLEVESASDMYWAYGAHVTDERGEAVEIQAITADELDEHSDDELIEDLTANGNRDVAEELVDKARSVYNAMQGISTELDAAIEAATDGDLERTVDALSRASRLEWEHGDDPSTAGLAGQLLEWIDEDEDEDEDDDGMGWNYAQQVSRPSWFGRNPSKIYFSLTSGSSFQNEWYSFDDRAQVIERIESANSEGLFFGDDYIHFNDEFYHIDQFTAESRAEAEGSEDYVLKPDATPVPMKHLLEAVSSAGFPCVRFQPGQEDDA